MACESSLYIFAIGLAGKFWDFVSWNWYLNCNAFLYLSARLYIPMMLSIRKYLYLASAQLNNPQRYILWQLVSIIIVKTIVYLILFLINVDEIAPHCAFMDLHAIPLIIQISYLGCNRRNLQKLIASFKFWNFIRNLFCKRSTVEPISVDLSTGKI